MAERHDAGEAQGSAIPVRRGSVGVVRFWVEPGTYKVEFKSLPKELKPPKYGTTVRLEEFAEGIEQIIRLAKAG